MKLVARLLTVVSVLLAACACDLGRLLAYSRNLEDAENVMKPDET